MTSPLLPAYEPNPTNKDLLMYVQVPADYDAPELKLKPGDFFILVREDGTEAAAMVHHVDMATRRIYFAATAYRIQ